MSDSPTPHRSPKQSPPHATQDTGGHSPRSPSPPVDLHTTLLPGHPPLTAAGGGGGGGGGNRDQGITGGRDPEYPTDMRTTVDRPVIHTLTLALVLIEAALVLTRIVLDLYDPVWFLRHHKTAWLLHFISVTLLTTFSLAVLGEILAWGPQAYFLGQGFADRAGEEDGPETGNGRGGGSGGGGGNAVGQSSHDTFLRPRYYYGHKWRGGIHMVDTAVTLAALLFEVLPTNPHYRHWGTLVVLLRLVRIGDVVAAFMDVAATNAEGRVRDLRQMVDYRDGRIQELTSQYRNMINHVMQQTEVARSSE
ncbi:hypothetical protein IWQ60_000586 [Tieghemiomyces parasiticus]|uniref:Uncharacterized protein n=1 Tax=Tieghemiomyces parasiticus TaxID=78921 RepID=A0A9W8E3A8_9FUNG|nr:hypothetical protein IWQ60_000586 [Tieghemiomyces parasiticus]